MRLVVDALPSGWHVQCVCKQFPFFTGLYLGLVLPYADWLLGYLDSSVWLCWIVCICIYVPRGDFKVAGVANETSQFFAMLSNASQKLLQVTRYFHPMGHFGLKMLWGEFVLIIVIVHSSQLGSHQQQLSLVCTVTSTKIGSSQCMYLTICVSVNSQAHLWITTLLSLHVTILNRMS